MCKADREVRPIFFNKTHYLHCTADEGVKQLQPYMSFGMYG